MCYIVSDCKTFRAEKEIEFSNVSYICPLTNKPYNVKSKDLHIDQDKHQLPFHKMVINFKEMYNIRDNELNTIINKNTGLSFSKCIITINIKRS